MTILRCTKKMLSELKPEPSDSIQQPGDFSSWHANLLRIDRRKCVLFTHDTTLYSFFVPELKNLILKIFVKFSGKIFSNL